MTTAFDWELLEHLATNDPVAYGLLLYDIDKDREVVDERLEQLRERGLANFHLSSRPTTWGITDEGRECLAMDIDDH